jgi:hypothetical protein
MPGAVANFPASAVRADPIHPRDCGVVHAASAGLRRGARGVRGVVAWCTPIGGQGCLLAVRQMTLRQSSRACMHALDGASAPGRVRCVRRLERVRSRTLRYAIRSDRRSGMSAGCQTGDYPGNRLEHARPLHAPTLGPSAPTLGPLQRWVRPLQRWVRPLQRWVRPLQRWVRPLQRRARPLQRRARPLQRRVRPLQRRARPL